jgi:hypothetical protein
MINESPLHMTQILGPGSITRSVQYQLIAREVMPILSALPPTPVQQCAAARVAI